MPPTSSRPGRAGSRSVRRTGHARVNTLVQREKRIVGSLCGSSIPLVDVPYLLELYRAGRLPIGALIGERYSLESINDAVADLTGGGVGRAIVLPNGERRLRT